jgi:hypothetical protein
MNTDEKLPEGTTPDSPPLGAGETPAADPAPTLETAASTATAEVKVEVSTPDPAADLSWESFAARLQASENKIEHVTVGQYTALVEAGLVNRSLRCLKTGKALEIQTPPQE